MAHHQPEMLTCPSMIPSNGSRPQCPRLILKQLEARLHKITSHLQKHINEDSNEERDDPLGLFTHWKPSLLVFAGSVCTTLSRADVWSKDACVGIADEYRKLIQSTPRSKALLEDMYYSGGHTDFLEIGTNGSNEEILGKLQERCYEWTTLLRSAVNPVFGQSDAALKTAFEATLGRVTIDKALSLSEKIQRPRLKIDIPGSDNPQLTLEEACRDLKRRYLGQ